MTEIKHDIEDNEIRIISSNSEHPRNKTSRHTPLMDSMPDQMLGIKEDSKSSTALMPTKPKRHRRLKWIFLILIILITTFIIKEVWTWISEKHEQRMETRITVVAQKSTGHQLSQIQGGISNKGYVDIIDTIIADTPLTIMIPRNATPRLHVGVDALLDTSAVLVAQAADIRGDNGGIVGAYVNEGHLLSRGQSKAGFCAIIDGVPTVGVADASPYLERAIETGGYFFRQYPLVVGGQIVENKPRNKSYRKALVEWNDQIAIIMSNSRLTFHDFSQSLVDLGVTNAIYLVGSTSFGFARDKDGNRVEFGKKVEVPPHNSNYIMWY